MTEPVTAPAAVPATAGALTTLGLGAAAWVVALRPMNGIDMGIATELCSFRSFLGFWVAMMAAMMLPGAVPVAPAIVGLGSVIVGSPSLFPGLEPTM